MLDDAGAGDVGTSDATQIGGGGPDTSFDTHDRYVAG
jgi:hypothetical protein